MITDAILGVLAGLGGFVVDLLPDAAPLGSEGFGAAVGLMRSLNGAVPVAEVLAMGAMCLTIIGGIFAVRAIVTVYQLIPGKFT